MSVYFFWLFSGMFHPVKSAAPLEGRRMGRRLHGIQDVYKKLHIPRDSDHVMWKLFDRFKEVPLHDSDWMIKHRRVHIDGVEYDVKRWFAEHCGYTYTKHTQILPTCEQGKLDLRREYICIAPWHQSGLSKPGDSDDERPTSVDES